MRIPANCLSEDKVSIDTWHYAPQRILGKFSWYLCVSGGFYG